MNCDQFYERSHWGASSGSPATDPNPRLEALLNAARRGATVRILLDSHFDQGGDNAATVAYLQGVARAEGLDVEARLADPTQRGLHNKMVWVEIVNPTGVAVDLSACKIGDAQSKGVFEGMYRFPAGTILPSQQALVIASSATQFRLDNPGRNADFEFYETDPSVPTLQPDPVWGTGEWHLSNEGDEIVLLGGSGRAVDVVVYGKGSFPGVVPHPGVSLSTHSLERVPYFSDTDDCSLDLRDWPFPNPGELPTER